MTPCRSTNPTFASPAKKTARLDAAGIRIPHFIDTARATSRSRRRGSTANHSEVFAGRTAAARDGRHAHELRITDASLQWQDAAVATPVDAAGPRPGRAAIRAAVADLSEGDILVVAGKGHEQGQTVGDVVHPFDDVSETADALHG